MWGLPDEDGLGRLDINWLEGRRLRVTVLSYGFPEQTVEPRWCLKEEKRNVGKG